MSETIKKATRQSYGEALAELSEKYDFAVLDADLAAATKTGIFKKKCPERFIDCGIAEANMMGVAAGLAAVGETVFAEYIAGLEKISALVYDYDHNAPDPDHLQATHEAFFRIIRNAKPELPVVIMSRPDTDKDPEDAALRRQIIRNTYERARAAGDQHVWFLDGGTFFGTHGRAECTVDGTHPNALGFQRMAEALYPLLQMILYGKGGET